MARLGFLTDTHVAYLRGDHDPPTDNAETKMRSDIRDRTKAAIQDLGLVARSRRLRPDDRRLLLDMETPKNTAPSAENVELVEADGETTVRYPGTGEGTHIRLPLDPDAPDADIEYGLWGRVGVATEMESILEFFYRTLREDGATREDVCSLIAVALETAEGKHQHSSPIGWRHKDVTATVEVETVDDVDTAAARQRFADGEDLSALELKALADSDEVEVTLSEYENQL